MLVVHSDPSFMVKWLLRAGAAVVAVVAAVAGAVSPFLRTGAVVVAANLRTLIGGVVCVCAVGAAVSIRLARPAPRWRPSATTAEARDTSHACARRPGDTRNPKELMPRCSLWMQQRRWWTLCRTGRSLGCQCVFRQPPERVLVTSSEDSPSNARAATPNSRLILDTCCTRHLLPRSFIAKAILQEWPATTTYNQVRAESSFSTSSAAVIAISAKDLQGQLTHLVLKVNVGPPDVPPLLKPKYIHLVPSPQKSWAVLVDYYGHERKVLVDDPLGECTGSLPSFLWWPADRTSLPGFCFAATSKPSPLSAEDILDAHERMLHPSAERLVGTLAEQGRPATVTEVRRHLGPCIVCSEKNAVHKKEPRSETRRGGEGSFNDTVWWDLGHISERGYTGQHVFSLMVDEETLWWDAIPLSKKSDAPDHLLKWHHDYGPMQALRSDNAGELKGTRVRVICRDSNVFMVTTPPYTSAANGVAERAIRELRSLFRTALAVLQLPLSIWPALIYGLATLHNVMFSPTLGSSPFRMRYGFPPRLTPLVGDEVVLRPPSQSKQPKSLLMPGRRFLYLGAMNTSTTIVYDRAAKTVVRVHPSQLLSFHPRSASTSPPTAVPVPPPSSSSAPRSTTQPNRSTTPHQVAVRPPGPAPSIPDAEQAPPPILWFRRSISSSSDSSSPSTTLHAANHVRGPQSSSQHDLPDVASPPRDADVNPGPQAQSLDSDVPRLPVAAEAGRTVDGSATPSGAHRVATRLSHPRPAGSPPASPRLAGKPGVVVLRWNVPTVALVLSRARGSLCVSYLNHIDDNKWSECHIGTVLPSAVLHEFIFNPNGGAPVSVFDALRRGQDSLSLNYCLVPSPSSYALTSLSPHHSPCVDDPRYERAVLDEFIAMLRNGVIGEETPPSPAVCACRG
eukprot:GHVU01060930.1.p1 GENE.GHVU01060930.1~~GHVU01060930.1.p1  ORF type:complete len:904 (+),score=77.37 GHVU01060930.1:1141-3852(+)